MDIFSALEAILFAAGEPVKLARLSLILETDEDELASVAAQLADRYEREGRGMRILRLADKLQMCSAPEYAPLITKALEQRKPPMLSQPALETLAITAYFQPVTRAYIDRVRGVDSSYTVSVLAERGLIEVCGHLEAPGRPALFRTTDVFLRTMGISELSQLPPLPDMTNGEGVEKLQKAIDELQNAVTPGQIVMEDLDGEAAKEG
ncbi:MAG: SMC-Scp complex subunit ScpB [Oscillospiraceae bacterium]|jgi:segregation and condensation protein B|nr:SMC-Scp complex subunit ScpB [Oscillospiraceae bacterium]